MTQWIYSFGDGKADGTVAQKNLLGGKGANLADMCSLGLPVPPGFTVTTDVCNAFYAQNRSYPEGLKSQIDDAIKKIEKGVGASFGDAANPLLVSVRSGARVSMPGMMDTVLNLGLNDKTVEGLAKKTGNPRFAYDSYRRFIQMYGDVVMGVDHYHFEELLELKKQDRDVELDTDLTAEDLKDLVKSYKKKVLEEKHTAFPDDVHKQLWGAIGAVFESWMNPRASTYRKMYDIPENWGTAVNIQAMVFGNMGETSATGVAFTRDPSTGEKLFYGEYLVNAQGEDVVAGIRTPQPLTLDAKKKGGHTLPAMEEVMPEVFKELVKIYQQLEKHYKDMQDIEFTVQSGKLWMLQTRNGKRTAPAALRIAAEMVEEGLITKEEGLLRIDPLSLDQLLHPTLDPKAKKTVIAKGLPASPGAASGKVVFSAEEAESLAARKEKVILVRVETSPEDIHGMHAAEGILTARGGMTSHAAVVARGMGRPCVSGAGELHISYEQRSFRVGSTDVKAGDIITINGSTGEVILGELPTIKPELSGHFATVMQWADAARSLKIRANAETPLDAETARNFGAEGIGLCRTEHMFFDAERILSVRAMILAKDAAARKIAINKLLPHQRNDFEKIFRIMQGLPVTIRLLDPPLHEFLPHTKSEMEEVARAIDVDVESIKRRAAELHEMNPMLGHRGCRLGISFPEIYEMQARAIFEAAALVNKEKKNSAIVEVMIPLVMHEKELKILRELVEHVATEVMKEKGVSFEYLVGTMIELPRAALRADKIGEFADFFSFGTNDLTQTTLGISRDDAGSFLSAYVQKGIFEKDPFVSLDQDGVGELIEIAAERGRKVKSKMKLGICGEHGGNPPSIEFCHRTGLDYVSCSPFRVPIARLAAAQAALKGKKDVKMKKVG